MEHCDSCSNLILLHICLYLYCDINEHRSREYTANYNYSMLLFIRDIIRDDSRSDLTGVSGVHGRYEGCYREQKEPDSAKCEGEEHR